ncbi:MAG: hypothetical protein ACJAVN_001821 [Roseivirga sp.]|jgi:hypothetical protein
MNNTLYFPLLKRQDISKYYKTNGELYATYNCQKNYDNVSKDCQYRCVYCDVHIDECGGEPFSLDHFRPMSVFGGKFNGILKIHPFNLYLSCQKCNVLKTNDWKGCLDTEDGQTFIDGKGYVDRFQVGITDYLEVDDYGRLRCTDNNGPAKYMIKKLLLNRTNRVYIRKLREVKDKAARISSMLGQKQRELVDDWTAQKLTNDEAKEKLEALSRLFERFERLGLIKM